MSDDVRTHSVESIAPAIELTPEHPLETVVDLAEGAERAGFRSALVSCHYFNRDPFVAADRIGRATDLLVGPAAANPYESHPVSLASRVGTLQEATGGRAVFGIAPGDRSTLSALSVERERPLRRVLETMQVARRCWTGQSVDHEGTFGAADAELRFSVDPVPVYVGAQGPDMIRMSAKYADGVLLNASHPRDVAWAAERIEEGLAERPDDRGEFEALAYASVSLAADGERAREAARAPVAFIVGGAVPPVLERHGIDREAAGRVSELVEAGDLREAFAAVTPGMLDAFAVAGAPDEVENRFEELLAYVDGVVVGSPLGPDPAEAVDLAGTVLSGLGRSA